MSSVPPANSNSDTSSLASLLSSLGGSGSSTGSGSTQSGSGLGPGLLSSPGIGSGLNVTSIVNALVNADIQPAQDQINNQQTAVQTQTSAVGKLKSLLSALQTSLSPLADGSAFSQLTAASSNTKDFTATAASGAVAGTYQVQVLQTATAQQLASGAFASGAAVGTGTLTLSVGGSSVNLTIDSSNDTLSGIAAAINGASDNPGVSATLINAADGQHLVLTSTQTGVANAASVSTTGGNGGLSALTWNASSGTGGMTQQIAAADAKVSVDGFTATSSTNVVSDAITGVTLNLAQADASTTDTLTVARDASAMQSDVKAFVTAYNNWVQGAQSLASYDANTQQGGPLLGDPTLLMIQSQLAREVSGTAGSGALNMLSSVGITLQSDGTLKLDTTKLGNAFASNPQGVSNLFSSAQGYGSQLNTLVGNYLEPGGLLADRNQALSAQTQQLQQQQDALNTRMQQVQKMYEQEFSNLDVVESQMKQTSSFLSTELNSLMAVYQPQSSSNSG